ncbi:hypothetical protein [Salinimonas chungwhensis]|uniref:hypothetical protein n=1 Tax=Salinimonas chungwhensis TaxID=265425 RepID=UPI0003690D9D|nr:hypothetical protein [Salinimonas chungwhensis]
MSDGIIQVDPEAASIQTHLGIIQNVVQRMATNSTNCKAWCVTLVAAVLVIIADKGKPEYAWISLLPTVVFFALDAYYLALEKGFRNCYNQFVAKIRSESLTEKDLYLVMPIGNMSTLQLEAIRSFSVWGFYISMCGLIAVTKFIALG